MATKKEEAMKTLKQAEELFKANDFRGAVMLAHKARILFPFLPGVVNVLVAYHVHDSARAKNPPSGDTNWHAVLGVPPSSDPEVMKKQYMNMRHLTHPDKCKSAAAEGAFQLVEEAWRCLNSPSPPTVDSTTSSEPQNMTSRPRSPPRPTRSGDAKGKPATRNSDDRLVCLDSQAELGFKTAVDNPVLSKCQSCHGRAMITQEDKFTDSSQPENGLPLSSQSSIPNFLLCPFCGTRNSYRVVDGLCHVICKRCGVPSFIKKDDGASFNKFEQTGVSLPSSQTGIAICRKCRIPYDGEVPNNRRILRRCKLCGSWASIKLEIKQIRVHEAAHTGSDLPNQTTAVVPHSGNEPSDLPTAGDLVRCPSGRAYKYLSKENKL